MNVWNVFWFLFLFLPLCILWVIALVDMMGRNDLVGWQKALWAMVIIFFPWIGVFAYLVVRPKEATAPSYGVRPDRAGLATPMYTPEPGSSTAPWQG